MKRTTAEEEGDTDDAEQQVKSTGGKEGGAESKVT